MRPEFYLRRMPKHLLSIVNFREWISVQYETVFVRATQPASMERRT
jgi:hypothetical protein